MSALRASSLDPAAKSPQIRWTTEMRVFLCCLVKYYEKLHDHFEVIFNKTFEAELAEAGFNNAIHVKWSRLHSQWVCMRNHGDPIWGDVHKTALDPAPWLPILETIERTAASLGLQLTRKVADIIDSSSFIYQTPASLPRPSMTNNQQLGPQELLNQDVEAFPKPLVTPQDTESKPSGKNADTYFCTAGGKLCFWCHIEDVEKKEADGLDSTQVPSLLFRWWNVKSQGVNSDTMFVAGKFTGIFNAYFEPDTISEEEFCSSIESHIRRYTVLSPFISTFKSALAPTHRSLRNQEGASIAIIDTSKLKSRVYSAKAFVQKHKLKIGRTYNGAGEYLIWGHVNAEAIVCTFQVTTLQRIAAKHLDVGHFLQLETIAAAEKNRGKLHRTMANKAVPLDKRAGATVGKLLSLLNVPQRYCRDASEGIAYSWRVKTRRLPWNEFFDGVHLGYRGEPVMDPRSPAPSPFHGANLAVDVDIDSDPETSYSYVTDEMSAEEDNAEVEVTNTLRVDDRSTEFILLSNPDIVPTRTSPAQTIPKRVNVPSANTNARATATMPIMNQNNNHFYALSLNADAMTTHTLPSQPRPTISSVFDTSSPNSFLTPTRPPRRRERRLASPIHLEHLERRQAMAIFEDSDHADDEMDDAVEPDIFVTATADQQRRASDRFAIDRARVWEALNRHI
ncbi:uncharacterized protein BDV14DRAFT_148439 [Aspergillus stella-maris]|uniref:uncharacterized protein n=1 Tax=Aspergillus stella-maris TaxID=1810926 RepID=UPI003CCD1AB2